MDCEPHHAWQVLYPPLQSHARGWLDVGDGHQIYWEVCGNPQGRPALFVHGGPGVGCTDSDRRWFDPSRWRIVLFDQRGAGRSRPQGALHANTTAHLVADMEALRVHLDLPRWLVFGGSWGATLALAYAQQHPLRLQALVLRGVFTATLAERHWLYNATGAATRHPQAWRRLCEAAVPSSHLLDGLSMALNGPPDGARRAARAWWQWEQDLMAPDTEAPPTAPLPPGGDDSTLFAAARIGVHYARHAFFLAEGQLLAGLPRMADLPGVIVQGDDDTVTPAVAARALHGAWPASRLHRVPGAGHASHHPQVARHLVDATDALADALTDSRPPTGAVPWLQTPARPRTPATPQATTAPASRAASS